MNKKIILISSLFILLSCVAAGAADYGFSYKKGKVTEKNGVITSGKNSAFAIYWGAAAELRCGPDSSLVVVKTGKTGESVFTLKSGSCFVRIMDDGSGASTALSTPFIKIKCGAGAFYAGCGEKAVSIYDGSARIEYDKRIAKLTAGRTFAAGKITEIQPGADAWKEWNFKRDKSRIYVRLQADKGKEEKTGKFLTEALIKKYGIESAEPAKEIEPHDLCAAVTVTAKWEALEASGIVSSGIDGAAGVISVNTRAEKAADPFESQAFLPFIYEVASSISKGLEQVEANALKKGRKVIIEADGLPEEGYLEVEKLLRKMPGFKSLDKKKYHNIKVVFETMLYGTGYDVTEVIDSGLKKSNINVWKYSKNIVKLRLNKGI